MPRPLKQVIDYFPHMVNQGKTLLILQDEFGNDGYAFWFRLLELLCKTDGQFYDYNSPATWRLLLAETHIKEDMALKILPMLAEIEAIDPVLYKKKIIWIQKLVDNLEQVYDRRESGKPQKPTISEQLPLIPEVPVNINPTSKQDKTKQDKTTASFQKGLELSEKLKSLMLANNPKARIPESLEPWANFFRLMIDVDHRPIEDIIKVIEFSQKDSFWHSNILSAKTLREKFDQLYLKMKASQGGDYHGTNAAYKKQPQGTSETPHAIDGDAEAS